MQSIALFTLFLTVSSALAAPSQQASEQVVAVSGPSVQQGSAAASPVVSQPVSSQVEGPQPVVSSGVEQPPVHHVVLSAQPHSGQHQQVQSPPGYYSPAGLIQVVGEAPVAGAKPVVGAVRSSEQYGQPESASLPANYKPFGSWGLYIGGNPADGYYTNYYKALTSSVDKQQQDSVAPVKPVVPGVSPNPTLRQAVEQPSISSSPYVGSDFYSFAYSPSDLNSPSVQPQLAQVAPAQSAQPVYGAPTAYDSSYGSLSPYADSFATKKVGAVYAQQKELVAQKEPSKGYQSRVYVYPSPVVAPLAAPGVVQHVSGSPAVQHQHAQVVAYPIPVGSQIVGSQSGVDGAFNPYGVHGFTRYAVKPTVVAGQDQAATYYYSYPSHQQQVVRASAPVYKQQQQSAHQQHVYSVQQAGAAPYYPLSYYGYPLSQLHYSHGSVVSAAHQGEHQHAPVVAGHGVELAASEKSETEEKQQVNKPTQQKRA